MWVSHKDHISKYHPVQGTYERTESTKQKLRDYRTGRITSEETKKKQREATLKLGLRPPRRSVGFKVPQDQIAAMRENHWRNTGCEIDGVRYRSFAEAGRALGIFRLTIRKRCLSPNFQNYKVIRL